MKFAERHPGMQNLKSPFINNFGAQMIKNIQITEKNIYLLGTDIFLYPELKALNNYPIQSIKPVPGRFMKAKEATKFVKK